MLEEAAINYLVYLVSVKSSKFYVRPEKISLDVILTVLLSSKSSLKDCSTQSFFCMAEEKLLDPKLSETDSTLKFCDCF